MRSYTARCTPSFFTSIVRKVSIVTRRHTKRILCQLPENLDATSYSGLFFWTATAKAVIVHCRPPVRPTKPLGTAFTSRMVRNRGAGLLEDSPTRASPGPQVRPLLAPCFTVRSPDRDMSPDFRPICLGAPDFLSWAHADDALSRAGVPNECASSGWS